MNPTSVQFQRTFTEQDKLEDSVADSSQLSVRDQVLRSTQLFADSPKRTLYWEALLLAAKNKKEEAKTIVSAIKENRDLPINPAWQQDKPENIDDFFDKLFLHEVWRNPQYLSDLRLFESIGLKDHNAFLNDFSLGSLDDNLEEKFNLLDTLKKYDFHSLTPEQQTGYKIFRWKLENEVAGGRFLFHNYYVNQMWGVIQQLVCTLTVHHKLVDAADIEDYITRLKAIPHQLRQMQDLLEYQRQNRIHLPRFAIEKTMSLCQNLTKQPIYENVLFTYFYQHLDELNVQNKHAIIDRVAHLLLNSVHNAFCDFHDYCEALLSSSHSNHGVGALPLGDEYYEYLLEKHTTTKMTPQQVHELGLKEVSQLQEEIKNILQNKNLYIEGKELGQQIFELSQDDRFYYENNEQGQKQCLEEFELILDNARKKLWPLFDLKPTMPVEVLPFPKTLEEGTPRACYFHPSLDGSRNGVFYVNMKDLKKLPIYEIETLAMHEAEPGHHFQVAIQYGMDLPVLRKTSTNFTAYVEGWALYAEKLAYENNFYSSALDQIGHLKADLWRAARLVIDTGIHYKGWSREEAISYFESTTGFGHDEVVTEVERYIVLPGGACAYKIGQLKILELRQRAKEMLGDKFKIQDFHNVVLSLGAAPLTILEEAVDQYIHRKMV